MAGIDEALAVVGAIDTSSQSGMLLAEAMLRATRDEGLRGTLAAELERARLTLAERVADGIADGEIRRGVAPGAVAALVVALLDGLFLHRLVSPGIDVGAIRAALGEMLAPPDRGGSRAAGRGALEGGS
jgi:AcrR family transcriptional regulator